MLDWYNVIDAALIYMFSIASGVYEKDEYSTSVWWLLHKLVVFFFGVSVEIPFRTRIFH